MGNNGVTSNSITVFSASGGFAGSATRYVSSTSTSTLGSNVWYYDPNSHLTTTIGLIAPYSTSAASNTESDGLEASLVQFINTSGVVGGRSAFYSNATATGGSASLGNAVWLYTPSNGTTTAVGFYDTQPSGTVGHIKTTTGTLSSTLVGLNNSGQAIGVSSRYDGPFSEGQDALDLQSFQRYHHQHRAYRGDL